MKNFLTQWKIEEENWKIGGGVPLIDRIPNSNVLFIDRAFNGDVLLIDRVPAYWKIMLNVYLSQSLQNW